MRARARLWRTAGGGLVEDGHADAATLAYAAGDELSAADEAALADPEPAEASSETKAASQVPNKAKRPQANKGG